MSKQQENIKISRLISEAKKKNFLEMKNTLIETFFLKSWNFGYS